MFWSFSVVLHFFFGISVVRWTSKQKKKKKVNQTYFYCKLQVHLELFLEFSIKPPLAAYMYKLLSIIRKININLFENTIFIIEFHKFTLVMRLFSKIYRKKTIIYVEQKYTNIHSQFLSHFSYTHITRSVGSRLRVYSFWF